MRYLIFAVLVFLTLCAVGCESHINDNLVIGDCFQDATVWIPEIKKEKDGHTAYRFKKCENCTVLCDFEETKEPK